MDRRQKDWTLTYGLDELKKMSIPTTDILDGPLGTFAKVYSLQDVIGSWSRKDILSY